MKTKKEIGQGSRILSDPERYVDDAIEKFRESAQQLRTDVVSYAKREPEKALLSALAAGYVLRTLPVLPIAGLLTRLTVGLFKPMALIYVAVKVIGRAQGKGAIDSGD